MCHSVYFSILSYFHSTYVKLLNENGLKIDIQVCIHYIVHVQINQTFRAI